MQKEVLLEWAKALKDSGKAIIVEGPNDRVALEYFNISNIYVLNKEPIYSVIEEVASKTKDVVILTDFDKKGKQLYGRIASGLSRLGVTVDNHFREFLQKNTRLSHIEGLRKYYENL